MFPRITCVKSQSLMIYGKLIAYLSKILPKKKKDFIYILIAFIKNMGKIRYFKQPTPKKGAIFADFQ